MLVLVSLLRELRGRLEVCVYVYMSGIHVETLFVYLFCRREKKNRTYGCVLRGSLCINQVVYLFCMKTCMCAFDLRMCIPHILY